MLVETERLRLRRWRPDDLDALQRVYGDERVARFVDDGQPITPAECQRWLHVTARNYARRGYGMAAIERRALGGVIGFCGLVHPADQEEPELKYALDPSHWGRGYATEAARALLAWGLERFGFPSLVATLDPANYASRRILLALGFTWRARTLDEHGLPTDLMRLEIPSAAPDRATTTLDAHSPSGGGPTSQNTKGTAGSG